jgi:hypothetical protein
MMVALLLGLILAAFPLLHGFDTLLSVFSHDLPHGAVSMIALSGFAGIFAGIAAAAVKSAPFKVHPLAKSSLSALFNRSLANIRIDGAFWGRIVIGGLVGWMVGAWLASAGFTSVPELFQGVYTLGNLIPTASGGFGGEPPPANIFGILFLVLLIFLAAPLAGLISGWLVRIALSAFAGMTKGVVKNYIEALLTDPERPASSGIKDGALGGFYVGLIAAIIQTICSIIGVIRFAG